MNGLLLATAVLVLSTGQASAHKPRTIAVLPFENRSLADARRYDALCRGLADFMSTELSVFSSLEVVERAELSKIMKEIALGQSGAFEEGSAAEVGNLLGAEILVLGSFMKDMGSRIRVDIRMVEVESGRVLKAEEASGRTKNLLKLVRKLVFKIAGGLDLAVSKEERKTLKSAGTTTFDALLAYSKGLEHLDNDRNEEALREFDEALELDPALERARHHRNHLREHTE